jgi:uncharacterized membrane protein YidH (DUF202 family)
MTAPTPAGLFDPGMQPERTALAWQRTALSMAVGSLVALRVFPLILGQWAIIPAAVALALAGLLFAASHLRYRRNHAALLADPAAPVLLAGGALIAVTAAVALALGVIAASILIATAARR